MKIQWIKISDLRTDTPFQRNHATSPSKRRSERIAKEYNASLFHPLNVADIAGWGKAAWDGETRLEAAKLMQWDKVPCLVETMTMEKAAQNFVEAQTHRKALTPWDRHRAGRVCGDEEVLAIDKIVGAVIGSGGESLIGKICARLHLEYRRSDLERVLRILNTVAGRAPRQANYFHNYLVGGLSQFLVSWGDKADDDRLVKTLQRKSPDELLQSHFTGTGVAKYDLGVKYNIQEAYNYKLGVKNKVGV